MQTDDDIVRAIAAAAMRIAAAKGWRSTGLIEVARAAGVPLPAFYRYSPCRAGLLAAVSRAADQEVLAEGAAPDAADPPRDRLFDVMMRRFDALQPYRGGLASVHRDLVGEPVTALAVSMQVRRSMARMLRAAGIEPGRPAGALWLTGLILLYTRVFPVWLADDTADLARTMAALDTGLRRAEGWAGGLCRSAVGPDDGPGAGGPSRSRVG